MSKRIVITGISSSIIKKMAARIDLSKYNVIGITRNPDLVTIEGIDIHKTDLTEVVDYSILMKDCFMIIHGAAITHTKNEKEYFKVNLDVTMKLVDAAKEHNVERFVFISSNTAGKSSGAYGESKLLAENYVKDNLENWIIFRITEVFGGNKNEGIEKLINDCLNKYLVLCPANIPSKLCPVHIDDVAEQMVNHALNPNDSNKTIIISGPKTYSYSEVIELVQRISKRKIRIIPLSRKIMLLVKWIAKLSPVNIGIVPDQVDRLYSVKEIIPNERSMIKLEDYIASLID